MDSVKNETRPCSLAAISGGLGDIGRAVAETLAAAGMDVAIGDIKENPEALQAVTRKVEAAGARCFFRMVDVVDAEDVDRWYAAIADHFGRAPDAIVSNAAIVTFKPLAEITAEEWRREMAVNVDGAFHWARAGVRELCAAERPGRVVFVGSWAAHAPHRNVPAYSTGKAAVRMLMKNMALEFASHGIRVNEVAPGYVDAGLSAQTFRKDPEARRRSERLVPTGALLDAHAVARSVRFLCGPDSEGFTGSTLLQDGGLSLFQGPKS